MLIAYGMVCGVATLLTVRLVRNRPEWVQLVGVVTLVAVIAAMAIALELLYVKKVNL